MKHSTILATAICIAAVGSFVACGGGGTTSTLPTAGQNSLTTGTTTTGTTAGTSPTGTSPTGTSPTGTTTTGTTTTGTTGSAIAGAACSPSNYGGIVNGQPLPAGFCAYSTYPFRNFVGPTPSSVDATNTSIVQQYAGNTSGQYLFAHSGSTVASLGSGGGGFPIYTASSSDQAVTVACSSLADGCSNGNAGSTDFSTHTFYIPAYARPGSTNSNDSGDENLAVVQPDGTTLDLFFYNCNSWSNWTSGEVVGTSVCSGTTEGADWANIVTDKGTNDGDIDGGENFEALIPHYEEIVNNTISHALELRVSCVTGSVYPGTGAGACTGVTGIPSGSLVHLRLTHAQIDTLISAGTEAAYLRPFLYAMSDYGGYVFDTSGPSNSLSFAGPVDIEDSGPAIRAGGANFWAPWFTANGATTISNGGGNTFILNINLLNPVKNNLEVLLPCHAQGSC